jgi:hypothetical protein
MPIDREKFMATLAEIFRPYIEQFFPNNAEIVDDGHRKIRVIYPIPETIPGRRYSRPVALELDEPVIKEIQQAHSNADHVRQKEIGTALQKLLKAGLQGYDETGDQFSAYKVYVDDRICDRP